jgi:L-threonylcarbamoyladenylate synthase
MGDARFSSDVRAAAAQIRAGELVAMPTETVYGLGADANDAAAVRKIFAAKGRPADHPLIVHVADVPTAQRFAREWPQSAQTLAAAFWPGPMTLIVKSASQVLSVVTGGQDTVGIRIPAHPIALALIRESGCAIAAPSANKFGHVSPTKPEHVAVEFSNDELKTILLSDDCEVGVESTIIDCTVWPVRILRPGRITAADVARALGTAPQLLEDNTDAPRVSGSLASHYAPRTPTFLKPTSAFSAPQVSGTIGTITFTVHPAFAGTHFPALHVPTAQVEHDLYANLRALDGAQLDEIWIETPPAGDAWDAVRDRITRASMRSN